MNILQRFFGVPTADSAANDNIVDAVGSKTDTVSGTSLIALTKIIDAVVDNIQVDIGDFSALGNFASLLDQLGIPDTAGKDLYTCLITDRLDNATYGLSAIQTQVDDIQDKIDGTDATATSLRREVGVTQVIEVSVTADANATVTTVATVTTQPCMIKSVVIHADAAQTGDMTSCAVEGGTNQVVEFVGAATAIQANLDAADKQVSWTGAVRLAATEVISIDLQGTGATAVDLTVTIEYVSCVDGGYLV